MYSSAKVANIPDLMETRLKYVDAVSNSIAYFWQRILFVILNSPSLYEHVSRVLEIKQIHDKLCFNACSLVFSFDVPLPLLALDLSNWSPFVFRKAMIFR